MQNNSKRTVHAADLLARRICEKGLLAAPGGPWRLYTDVPLWCLGAQTVTALDEPRAADWKPYVDLLICRGSTAVLAVALAPRLYPAVDLPGVAELDPDLPRTLPRGRAEDAAAHLLPMVAEQLRGPAPRDHDAARYLPASACAVMGWGDRELAERLERLQMLTYGSTVTGYGRACGLFWEYENDRGRAVRRLAFHNGSKGLMLRLLAPTPPRPLPRPGLPRTAPLAARLERLERGEDSAGAPEDHLQGLLDTPLPVLCGGANSADYRRLRQCLDRALDLLGARQTGVNTYADALRTVRNLRERFTACGGQALCEAEKTILRELLVQFQNPRLRPVPPAAANGDAAAPRPLAERLDSAGGSRPANYFGPLPLKSYFAAAARRLQSGYPNWIYQRQFKSRMNLEKNSEEEHTMFVMAYAARLMFEEEDENTFLDGAETGGACYTYDLLVEPVFPDPQLQARYCDVR